MSTTTTTLETFAKLDHKMTTEFDALLLVLGLAAVIIIVLIGLGFSQR